MAGICSKHIEMDESCLTCVYSAWKEQEHENDQLRAVLSGFVNWTAAYKSGCPCTNCKARTLLGDYDH